MNSFEKKLLSKIDQFFPFFVLFFVTILAALLRISVRGIISLDAETCLLPWYLEIANNGLSNQVGNYNLLYQFLIWIMTKLPIPPLFSYKLLSCLFDYLLAIFSAMIVMQIDSKNRMWNGIWTYSSILLCPVVFVDSAVWAQCDAIFCAFAFLGLYFLGKEKYNWAMIALGISFAFKLQAVFFLPIYLFIYFVRRKFSIVRFLLIPLTMLVISSPLLFWGRNLFEVFSIYFDQTATFSQMSLSYPSFWIIICEAANSRHHELLKNLAIVFTVCVFALILIFWITKKYSSTGKNLISMTFILIYTAVLFLPSMHERYGYPYVICSIILAILIPKTAALCVGIVLLNLHTYGDFLFGIHINLSLLTVMNLIIYALYFYVLTSELQKDTLCEPNKNP